MMHIVTLRRAQITEHEKFTFRLSYTFMYVIPRKKLSRKAVPARDPPRKHVENLNRTTSFLLLAIKLLAITMYI